TTLPAESGQNYVQGTPKRSSARSVVGLRFPAAAGNQARRPLLLSAVFGSTNWRRHGFFVPLRVGQAFKALIKYGKGYVAIKDHVNLSKVVASKWPPRNRSPGCGARSLVLARPSAHAGSMLDQHWTRSAW